MQDHTFQNIHLALGYLGVVFVAAAAAYEYKVGFKEAKGISMLSVGAYFILHGAQYFWTNYINRNIVYIGKKGGLTVCSPSFLTPTIVCGFSGVLTNGGAWLDGDLDGGEKV